MMHGNKKIKFRFEIKYGVISAILQYIGRATDDAKDQYIVGFFNDALSEYLAFSHWARSNLEDVEEVRLFWKVCESYPDKLENFPDEKGEWKFNLWK